MFRFIRRLFMSIAVGLISGLMVLFFSIAIDSGVSMIRTHVLPLSFAYFWLPILGAVLVIGLNRLYQKDDHSGIGIVQVLVELELIKTHFMRPFRVLTRVISATISLIFGFSVGRFGPIVHLGSAIGSNIGYYLKMSSDDVRILIGCGASAAISVVFGTPLFAAVFVLEVLFRKQYAQFFAPVVISSIVGYLIGDRIVGVPDIFIVAESVEFRLFDLLIYIGLGVFTSLLGMAYMSSIEWSGKLFEKMPSKSARLILAAVLTGAIAFAFPLNMELHGHTTLGVLAGNFGLMTLALIILLKILGTGIALGSGYVGGNFYPGVTIGASFGMLYSRLIFPLEHHPAFGLFGIGGMISGYLNAPISGIVFVLEASGNMTLMIPALIVCSVSTMLVNHLYGRDIFTKLYNKFIVENKKMLDNLL